MPGSDRPLPPRPAEWKTAAKEHGVLQTNIQDLEGLDSASKIKDRQFFALRILWQPKKDLPNGLELCNGSCLKQARDFLKGKQAWEIYLNDIKTSTGSSPLGVSDRLGTFSLVRYYQKRSCLSPRAHPEYDLTDDDIISVSPKIIRSPVLAQRLRSRDLPTQAPSEAPETPTPVPGFKRANRQLDMGQLRGPINEIGESSHDTPPRGSNDPPSPESPANAARSVTPEDEILVNTALILFIESITIYHLDLQGFYSPRWTSKPLQLKFSSWVARTDGFLRLDSDDEKVAAIMETKPYVRQKDLRGIQKQEGAQMAAWIHQCPNNHLPGSGEEGRCFRRLLVSQDSHEIYLTIAEYDYDYMNYLHGNVQATIGKPSLMVMTQYGPWNTKNYEHMEHVGFILLAFTLQHISTHVSQTDPFIDS
ncbi:hypothetical protein MMC07_000856 [Pseudocyphellaria aurata]|nr:hypothetical protein [Pseudocyphellaria aurata]